MTDRDLENLKSLPVPPARAEAKRAAFDAAMAAFMSASETAATALPAGSAQETSVAQNNVPAKGNVAPFGQTETSQRKRSFRMLSSRSLQAVAASVAAMAIVAPFAFQHMRDATPGTMTKVITELKQGSDRSSPVPPAETQLSQVPRKMPAPSDSERARLAELTKQKDDARRKTEAVKPVAPPAQPPVAPASQDKNAVIHDQGTTLGNSAKFTGQSNLGLGSTQYSDNARIIVDGTRAALPAAKSGMIAGAPSEGRNPQAWMGRADEVRTVITEDNRDKFDAKEVNAIKQVASEPVSTFSIDVDTASYSFVRRALNAGQKPPRDAVRVEEMINYFPYAYPAPESVDVPFKPTVTVLPSPWNAHNKLVHVAIKGYDLKSAERPHANLVFLIDVSGSMGPQDRLPLVKNAFRMLLDQLKPDDTVGIVTYASGSGIALEPTKASDKGKILSAIDRLGAGGSTAGAAGIQDAYRLAEAGFDKNAVNRIILATDGDFNVGITDHGQLKSYIETKRKSGIFLSILGVGRGNHNDALMQTLAQNGNGTAAYVDTLSEARKVLVEESSSTLFTIAKDVKAQIEWNPARVAEYRLIGYETRALRREDFNNDRVDAGDIGSGHTVTAIYEVTPVGGPLAADALRYGKPVPVAAEPSSDKQASHELGFLKLRYKRPNEDTSQLISLPVTDPFAGIDPKLGPNVPALPYASEMNFSIAVAAFAQMLKGESYTQGFTFDDVLALAQSARGDDPFGYRAEFLNLVRLAKSAQ